MSEKGFEVAVHGNSRITIYLGHREARFLEEILYLVDFSDGSEVAEFAMILHRDLYTKTSCNKKLSVVDVPIFPWSLHPHIRKEDERDEEFRQALAELRALRRTGR